MLQWGAKSFCLDKTFSDGEKNISQKKNKKTKKKKTYLYLFQGTGYLYFFGSSLQSSHSK